MLGMTLPMVSMAPMMKSIRPTGTLMNFGSRPASSNSISACSRAVYALPGPTAESGAGSSEHQYRALTDRENGFLHSSNK